MTRSLIAFTLSGILLLPASTVLIGCSNDDEVVETVNPDSHLEDEDSPLPPDVLEKVHAIYDHASVGPQRVTTVNQLAILTSICASDEFGGPISVTEAALDGNPITLITLGGTEEVEGQATTMVESQLASFGKPNDYLRALCKLFENGTVPQNRPVMLTGISLGGMIAQQMLSQEDICEQFDIRAIVTFGSPLTLPVDRRGVKVVRFTDAHDKVPKMGESVLRMGLVKVEGYTRQELMKKFDEMDAMEKIVRTSKYTDMLETHALSYIEDDCWSGTDFLGDESKSHVLDLKQTMNFYPAPKLDAE